MGELGSNRNSWLERNLIEPRQCLLTLRCLFQ